MNLRFVQIVSSQWENPKGELQTTIFALTSDGRVFKFIGKGWRELPSNIIIDDREK